MSMAMSIHAEQTRSEIQSGVEAGISSAGAKFVAASPRLWRLEPRKPLGMGMALLEPHWISVSAPIIGEPGEVADARVLLAANARAAAGIKLALMPAVGSIGTVVVYAALATDSCGVEELPERIGEIYAGMSDLAGRLGMDGDESRAAKAAAGPSQGLGKIVAESGWSGESRNEGARFSVPLETQRVPSRANVELTPDGGAIAWVDFPAEQLVDCDGDPDAEEPDPICRRAAAVLLLTETARVRSVRAALDRNGAARLEVKTRSPATGGELSHALAALSTICEHIAPEARLLLSSRTMAHAFLTRGGSSLTPMAG